MVSKCVSVLAIALIASAVAAPFQDDYNYDYLQSDQPTDLRQCANTCPTGATTKFAYMSGQTYSYQYDADIKTSIPSSTEHSSLHVQAKANIEVISACEMVLRLADVTLQDSDPTQYNNRQYVDQSRQFKESLESKPLRFAFIDGTIENICPPDNEQVWVLNIKRGILSTLQVTMATLQGVSEKTETDVSGVCPVKYEETSNWGTLKVKKTKNLLGCTERSSAQTAFQTVGYKAPSDIQEVPLLQGTQECTQEINGKSKVLTKSECKESHVFRPFNNEGSGATTEITYKLVFQKQSEGIRSENVQSRSRLPLLFDHSVSEAEMSATVRDAQETLTQLCRQTSVDVRPEAPANFSILVKQMRRLDARNLRQLMSATKSGPCSKAETYFRDALPVLGTAASVAVIRDLVTKNTVSGPEADLLLTSIAFIKNPTTETMKELQALLSADFIRSALPVSSVVHTYCKLTDRESPEVVGIIKTLEDELRYNCKVDGGDASRILLALRAIGNAGNADRVTPTLNRCALNQDAPMAVRVAAVASYRRISCSSSREEMFNLFENRQQDSELRIAAYLATMQCADHATLGRIRAVLEAEEVNQVGSFVWSHLTNLAESANPLKSDIQEILTDPHLLKEFDVDKRKFSRNIELSTFNEMLNLGASVESNLIWSTGSYIPRSASFNLTADLFGQSVNLLEVGGRAQGLEQLMEKYFGPGSEFDKQSDREKRAVIRDDVINNIDRKYSKSRDSTQLSYYLRVFGNEIKSGDIYNLNIDEIKSKFNVLDLLVQLAQDRSVDFTRNFAFLDTDVAIPTGVGMPLRLGVEATATVALNARGKIDVRKMLSSPSTFDISGSIRPSVAVEIQGEFGVDAQVTRTRLRVSNTIHSSTLLDGKLTLKDGQVFNAEWNMPQEKMEIFSAQSHFYISHRNQEREQSVKDQKLVQKKRCTDQAVSNKVGLELCGELSYPGQTNAKFPLSGPAVVKLYLNKLDTFTSARLEASVIRTQDVDTARFSFATPGSRVDREITADFKLDRPKKELAINVKSPWKKISVTGQIVDQPTLKRAVLRGVVDENKEYSISAELAITDQTGTEIKYTPSAKITIPGREAITLDGELTYIKKKKVFGKVAIRNAVSEPITAEGSVELQDKRKSQKYDANIQFSSPIVRGSLSGFVSSIQDNGNAWASRADINYQYKNGNKQRIVINHKIRDTSTANLKSFSTDGSWTTTMFPRYNGNFAIEEQYSATSLRTKIEAGFDNTRRIIILQNGAFDFTGTDKKFNGMIKFELPFKNWNYEVKLDHKHNYDQLQSNASVKYDENKEHTFDLGVRKDNTQYLSMYGEAKLKMAGYSPMTLTNTLREKTPREYHNELNVGAPRRSIRAVSVYKMGQKHEFSTDVQATGFEPITVKAHLNPNPMNMQARAEVKYGQKEYMADLSWLHRGNAQSFNTRAAGEIGYHGKTYGLSGEVSKRNQDFSVSAEAKTGDNRKISVSGQVTASLTQPKADLRLEWPGNFINVASSAKYETQGWLQTTNDLEAAVKVTTSIRGFEEMGGNIKIDVSRDSLKSNGELTWAPNRKIVGDLFYDKSRAGLNLATPFPGYRTIKGDMTYQLRGRSVNGNAQLQWESKRISVTGTSTYESGRGYAVKSNGQLTINTPWSGYMTNKLTWSHENDDGTKWKCHHEFEREDRNKYVLDIDATNNGVPGRSHQLNFKALFTSPIENWRQVGVNWETNHDYQSIRGQGRGSVTWGNTAITYEHDVNIQAYSTFVAKAKVTTPYRGYEVMAVDFDNRLNPRSNAYTLTNEITLGNPRSKLNVDGTLSFNLPTFIAGIRIITPIEDLPRIVMNVRNSRQQDGSWALHADAEYNPSKSYSLDAKLSMDRTYGAELSMTSPHQYLRTLNAKALATVTSPKRFDVTAELSHNMMRDKIKFQSSVDVEALRSARIEASLQTPYAPISSARLSLSHVYETQEKCTTTASYQLNEHRGQLTHDQTIRRATNFEGRTRVEYLNGRSITFEHKVDINPGRRSTISASLNTPYRQANSVELLINVDGSLNNFRSTGEITYNRRDKISANLDHTLDPNNGILTSSLRIVTPYNSLQRFVLSFEHTGTNFNNEGPNWNAKTETKMEINDRKWYAKRSIDVMNGAVKLNAKTETPYESTRSSEFNFEHTPKTGRNGNGWSNNGFLDMNGKKYNGESEYLWIGKQLRAKIITNVPDEYSIIFNHKADSNELSTDINMKAGRHASGTVIFKMDSAGTIDAHALLETPYSGYEKFDISLKHEGPISNFRTTLNVVTSIRDYENFAATLMYRGNPSDFTSQLLINTPFRNLPTLTVKINHRYSTSSGLNSGASVEYNGKKLSTDLTYKNDRRNANARLNISTPYKGYESMTAEIEHSGSSWRSFRTNGKLSTSHPDLPQSSILIDMNAMNSADVRLNGQLTLPSGTVRAVYSHSSTSSNDFRCSLQVTTPFKNFEQLINAEIEHQGSAASTKVNIQIPVGSLTVERTGTLTNLSLKAELRTNFKGQGRNSASWTHTIADGSFDIKAQIETGIRNFEKMGINWSAASKRGGFSSMGTVETSIPGHDRYTYNIDHSMIRRNVKTSAEMNLPYAGYEKIGGNVEYSGGQGEGFRASVQLTTPFRNYRDFALTVNHAGTAAQFETSGRITTPFNKAQQIDYTIKHRGDSIKDFTTSVSADYSGKKIQVETSFRLNKPSHYESGYEGSLKMATPCPYFRDLSVTASHIRKPELKSGGLAVTLNSEKKIDMDYSYTTGGNRNIVINLRDPWPMATNLNMADSTGSAVVNWDTTNDNKKVRFDFGFKDIETSSNKEKLLSLKVITPRRAAGFSWGYTLTSDKFTNRGELLWNTDSRPDFVYEIQGSKSERRNMNSYDAGFKVMSRLINWDTTFSHKSQPGRKYTTEIGLQSTDKLTIRSDYTVHPSSDFSHSFTMTHPRFTRDVSVVTETKNGNSFTSTLNFDRQTLTLEGNLVDESRYGSSKRHSAMLRLYHPISFTDVKLSGTIYADAEKMGGNVKGEYQTSRDRQMQTAELRAEINKIRRELNAELSTPLDTYKLSTTNRDMNDEQGVYRYDVTTSCTHFNYRSSVDISAKDRSCDIKLFNTDGDSVQMFAQFFRPTQITFDISRVQRGQKINDVRFSLSRSDDRILTGYTNIRPDILRDIQTYYYTATRTQSPLAREWSRTMEKFINTAQDEIDLKSRYFSDAITPLRNAYNSLTNDYNDKVAEIKSSFNDAYRRNDFYMRDIHQALKRQYEDISRRVHYKMMELQRCCQAIKERVQQTNQVVADKFNEAYDWLEKETRDARNEINERMQRTQMYMDEISRNIQAKMMENSENIRRHPLIARISNLKPEEILQFPGMIAQYARGVYEQLMYRLQAIYEQTASRPDVKQLQYSIMRYIQENKRLFQYFGLEQKVEEFMQRLQRMNWPTMKAMLEQSLTRSIQWNKNRWTKFDPQRGEYEFEVYMPIDVPDMSWLKQLDMSEYLANTRRTIARYLPEEDWSLMDTIYAYKPRSNPRDWIPPFKAHASLVGSQHYVTFDKKFYDFAGDCSYLLARDFIDKTFSIVVNYERGGRVGQPIKKSISVLTDGKQVEIMPDAKTTIDGSRIEMPFRFGNTTVSRQESSVVVRTDLGVEVNCDLPHDHCTVSMPGWFYDKTAGLLGTYDNEPSNDFTTSDKTVVDRPETMAESWTVGPRCRTTNRVVSTSIDTNTRRYRACAKLFKDESSTFRSCFRVVPAEKYMEMCVRDVPMGDNSLEAEEDTCRIAAAYRHECQRHETHVRMPNECIQCEVTISDKTSDKFYESDVKTLEGDQVPQAADVVFVVQHAECNRDVIEKVKSVIDDMDKAFRSKGIKSTQYSVIGFGGMEHLSSPQIRTMDGQIFSSASKLSTAFNNFDLQAGLSPDAMGALIYAAKLPFRAGASKSIILIPCDSCTEQSVGYSEVHRVLMQSDIHLHVLVQDLIQLKSRSPKTSQIFGVDDDTVYTGKDVSGTEVEGEADLRKYIRMPKDLCVALTQDTEGSVFSVKQWMDSRGNIQKKFADVFVRTVANKGVPTECQYCECVTDKNGVGVSQCRSCYPRSTLLSLMPNFNGDDYSDNLVSEVSRTNEGRPQENWLTPAPPRATPAPKRKGDRVNRGGQPRKAPPTRRIPVKPKVKDQ